ncbi:MAG: hypothetical protein VX610_06240 [SAR324 cluster bacterium]|nr:hypothetical protein [SAR324 cluster bacterium]
MRIHLILLTVLLLGSTLAFAQAPPKSASAPPPVYDEEYLSLWAKRLALMQAARGRPSKYGGKYAPPKTAAGNRVYSEDAMPKGRMNPSFTAPPRQGT